ncbi:rhomboid family intramembrane serine protease [Phenylobacterium sp.]|uniref:rhomboid family intramembrane serine protease n=1 Tax=Phenylobacterium sp. TaxID=1871053 RepID=UPI002F95364C
MTATRFQQSADDPRLPPRRDSGRRTREPVFNKAAWPVLALVGSIIGGYAVQSRVDVDAVAAAFAFTPTDLGTGRWWTLLSSQFLHGGWAHALMNAAFILAFGTPVARFLGLRLGGALLFYGFYLASGALAALGFAAVHAGEAVALIGASGAASGLMGASARLIGGYGAVGPILSRPVLSMGAAWLLMNLIIAVFGAALAPGAGDAAVGWEAHLAGFAAGVLLMGPFGWIARRG